MTRLERKAALAVAAATAGVIVSGVALIRKHTKYLAQKAAATFGPDDEEEETVTAETADAETADAETADAESVDTKDTETADTEAADVETAETEAADTETAEAETAESTTESEGN